MSVKRCVCVERSENGQTRFLCVGLSPNFSVSDRNRFIEPIRDAKMCFAKVTHHRFRKIYVLPFPTIIPM